MKKVIATVTLVGLLTLPAAAVIEPIIIKIDTAENYTVPSGKAFLIRNVPIFGANLLVLTKGPEVINLSSAAFGSSVNWPVTIPAGWDLTTSGGTGTVVLFGELVDPSDLFAGIQSEFESVAKAALSLTGDLKTASARPARFKLESTDDLKSGWDPVPDAQVSPTTDKTKYDFIAPVSDHALFLRARARPHTK